jgi:hypothetical protein
MKLIDIMRSNEYKKILTTSFDMGDQITFTDYFPPDYFEILRTLVDTDTIYDNAFTSIKIAQNAEFCFVLEDKYIGVFQNKYIISFNKGPAGFDFIGDNISNWIDHFWHSSVDDNVDFKLKCYQQFNTPITKYDEWDTSYVPLIEALFK